MSATVTVYYVKRDYASGLQAQHGELAKFFDRATADWTVRHMGDGAYVEERQELASAQLPAHQ